METYISKLFSKLNSKDVVITSTGIISRIAWSVYNKKNYKFAFFPMTGSMGGTLPISLGIAQNAPSKRVWCLTGDGSLLMKFGALATYLEKQPKNLKIIVLNNDCHDSTGGQYTNFNKVRKFVEQYCEVVDVKIIDRRANYNRIKYLPDITTNFRKTI